MCGLRVDGTCKLTPWRQRKSEPCRDPGSSRAGEAARCCCPWRTGRRSAGCIGRRDADQGDRATPLHAPPRGLVEGKLVALARHSRDGSHHARFNVAGVVPKRASSCEATAREPDRYGGSLRERDAVLRCCRRQYFARPTSFLRRRSRSARSRAVRSALRSAASARARSRANSSSSCRVR